MLLVIALVLLVVSFFLTLSEMALVALSKLRLQHLVARGARNAQLLQRLVNRMDEVITSIVTMNNFINTALSSLGAALCIAWLGPQWGVLAATLLMGTVIVALAEITPKVFAIRHADRLALLLAPAVAILVRVVGPVTRIFTAFSNGLLRLCGVELKARSPLVTEEEIRIMIEVGKEHGVLSEEERTLLHRIFEFGDLKVEDVMIPREQMVAVHDKASHDEVLTLLTEKGHSRIPVYHDSPDRIVGVIYAQEILHIWREGWLIVLQDLIHPPFEVKPDSRVIDLLREFQRKHLQIAIVVDGEGKALGLATLEDLFEEIVGEIHQENA
ncbi:MAG: hemolysin family protein [Candidatus Omnitrophota bacterium]|nr:hemolysin family protein [Candidatus Omnitrophota bacterium]